MLDKKVVLEVWLLNVRIVGGSVIPVTYFICCVGATGSTDENTTQKDKKYKLLKGGRVNGTIQ